MIFITLNQQKICKFICNFLTQTINIQNITKKIYLKKTANHFKMESNKKIIKEEWIKKDLKNKIPKLDKKTIFVPRKNELNF